MLSLVTDYQWNRKHIFLKSLTLISKLFPYWNKTDPRRVKLRLFFFFSQVRIKVQLGNVFFFSRPPVGADKQKSLYPTQSYVRWNTWLKTFKSKESWASQWGLFLTSVACGGEALQKWTKASLSCLLSNPILCSEGSGVHPTAWGEPGGGDASWG